MRSQPAPGDTAIGRLRIIGPPGAIPQLQREFALADWPSAPSGSWVFIRAVRVAGPPNRIARALSTETRRLLASASPGARGGDAVRFDSLAELLAALLTDLAGGLAQDRWYWQRWSPLFALPRGRAIAALVSEHLPELASVCARLGEARALEAVWLAMSPDDARGLVTELSRRGGYRLSGGVGDMTGSRRAVLEAPGAAANAVPLWGVTLARLQSTDPRRVLALLVIAQEIAPLSLRNESGPLLATLDRLLPPAPGMNDQAESQSTPPTPSAAEAAPKLPRDFPAAGPSAAPSMPEVGARYPEAFPDRAQARAAAEGETDGGVPSDEAADTASRSGTSFPRRLDGRNAPPQSAAPADPLAAPPGLRSASPTAEQESPARPRHPILTPDDPTPDAGSERFGSFRTAQGGVFYLLNFLNRPPLQALMARAWQQLPSGWAWLYLIGRELALPADDPVVRFLADQLDPESATVLADLPPLPERQQVLTYAEAWYGRAGLWRPELLAVDAMIRFSPSELELHARLTAVRLPIRLAGLDLDPGWLPWLGRVVTFHFDD